MSLQEAQIPGASETQIGVTKVDRENEDGNSDNI